MKKLWMLLLLAAIATGTRAQTIDEWLRQKKTQQEYLLEQIAALRLYTGYVQQGYALTREGLGGIGTGKEVEQGLHAAFFRSLSQVRTAVANYWKVAAVLALQEEIVQVCFRTRQQVEASGVFGAEEKAYIQRVMQSLVQEGVGVLADLEAVTRHDRVVMGEEERLRRVEAAYSLMVAQYQFARRFGNDTLLLAAARLQEKHDRQQSRMLHGITPDVP